MTSKYMKSEFFLGKKKVEIIHSIIIRNFIRIIRNTCSISD